jgi:hypothetical protein
MRTTLISLAVLLLQGGILAAAPAAAPATRPTLKLTDKQILAGYDDVALKTSQTRDGIPRRNGSIKTEDGSRVQIAIIGQEGHPVMIMLPSMTLVPGAVEGNSDTLKVAQTIFCNVVDAAEEKAQFKKMLRDLMDALKNGQEDLTRDIGDVRVVLEGMKAQNNDNYIDVTLTLKPKGG